MRYQEVKDHVETKSAISVPRYLDYVIYRYQPVTRRKMSPRFPSNRHSTLTASWVSNYTKCPSLRQKHRRWKLPPTRTICQIACPSRQSPTLIFCTAHTMTGMLGMLYKICSSFSKVWTDALTLVTAHLPRNPGLFH